MGTRFPGINSDPLDVRLGDGQITWTENTSELSTMSEHGGSSHGLGWSQIYPKFSATGNCRLFLGTIQPPSCTCLGIRNVLYLCRSISQSRLLPEDAQRCISIETPEQHTLNIIMVTSVGTAESPGSWNCPWHELVLHRKSKSDQNAISCKGWIWTSGHMEETIMSPLLILARQCTGARGTCLPHSSQHREENFITFPLEIVVETPQITTSCSCLQWVKNSSHESTKLGNRGVNFW